MSARIGADDVGRELDVPRPELLRLITGIEPERSGLHVLLDEHAGVQSIQRLALSALGRHVLVSFWPAELQSQARFFYSAGRSIGAIAAARERGWDVRPSPHIAFFTSPPSQRLYMSPYVDAAVYARRWEDGDLERVAQYSHEDVRGDLWPWLQERAYATDADNDVLDEFLRILGRRPSHLRPGLRFRKAWPPRTDEGSLADEIRGEVNAILAAAGERPLPGV